MSAQVTEHHDYNSFLETVGFLTSPRSWFIHTEFLFIHTVKNFINWSGE